MAVAAGDEVVEKVVGKAEEGGKAADEGSAGLPLPRPDSDLRPDLQPGSPRGGPVGVTGTTSGNSNAIRDGGPAREVGPWTRRMVGTAAPAAGTTVATTVDTTTDTTVVKTVVKTVDTTFDQMVALSARVGSASWTSAV